MRYLKNQCYYIINTLGMAPGRDFLVNVSIATARYRIFGMFPNIVTVYDLDQIFL